jgi:hypothetical protein
MNFDKYPVGIPSWPKYMAGKEERRYKASCDIRKK